jgi:hypothetical protein
MNSDRLILADYFADDRGGGRCFFVDCEIRKKVIKVEFAYWFPRIRGSLLLSNDRGDRLLMEVPKFVWEMESRDFLYQAEYPILEFYHGREHD